MSTLLSTYCAREQKYRGFYIKKNIKKCGRRGRNPQTLTGQGFQRSRPVDGPWTGLWDMSINYLSEVLQMAREQTFYTWLAGAVHEQTPVGDLARDVYEDRCFPKHDDPQAIMGYLMARGACVGAIDAFKKAWRVYKAGNHVELTGMRPGAETEWRTYGREIFELRNRLQGAAIKHQGLLPNRFTRQLLGMVDFLDRFRSRAEDEMFEHGGPQDIRVWYPGDDPDQDKAAKGAQP